MTNGASSGFRGQLLWQKAQAFAAELVVFLKDLPNDRAAESIARQLIRSGSSIAANVAEGYGRYSPGAYRNHLSIARGSAFESESWIDLLVRTGYLKGESGERLLAQCAELQKLLSYRMKALEESKPRTLREEQSLYEFN
jgi:four helix bundle protein